jgi:hypothetical protein
MTRSGVSSSDICGRSELYWFRTTNIGSIDIRLSFIDDASRGTLR